MFGVLITWTFLVIYCEKKCGSHHGPVGQNVWHIVVFFLKLLSSFRVWKIILQTGRQVSSPSHMTTFLFEETGKISNSPFSCVCVCNKSILISLQTSRFIIICKSLSLSARLPPTTYKISSSSSLASLSLSLSVETLRIEGQKNRERTLSTGCLFTKPVWLRLRRGRNLFQFSSQRRRDQWRQFEQVWMYAMWGRRSSISRQESVSELL